jgi:hypothetical protein
MVALLNLLGISMGLVKQYFSQPKKALICNHISLTSISSSRSGQAATRNPRINIRLPIHNQLTSGL